MKVFQKTCSTKSIVNNQLSYWLKMFTLFTQNISFHRLMRLTTHKKQLGDQVVMLGILGFYFCITTFSISLIFPKSGFGSQMTTVGLTEVPSKQYFETLQNFLFCCFFLLLNVTSLRFRITISARAPQYLQRIS